MIKPFIALLCAFAFFASPVHAADKLSETQEEEVRKLIRETLISNPDIVMEALQVLQERQQAAQREQQGRMLSSLKDRIINGSFTPIEGNTDGDVVLIEFSDYQCGYCKRAFPGVLDVVTKDKNIKYVVKEFAILGPASELAARAALAAKMQDKYMELHIALMNDRGRLSEQKILTIAKDLGIDTDQLVIDMQDERITAELNETKQLAQALGFTGTPAFIINDQIIPGAAPPEALREAVKNAREKL